MPKSALDTQVGGEHYKGYRIQPAQFFHANKTPFLEANVVKYVLRHQDKNGRQDLEKAKHYLDLILELEYPVEQSPSNL